MSVAWAKRAFQQAPFNGDQVGCWRKADKTFLCVVDGLGHGQQAEQAALAALASVERHLGLPVQQIFTLCNQEVEWSHGVALALAIIDETAGEVVYAAVGNIRAICLQKNVSRLNCSYGIIGAGFKKLYQQRLTLQPGDMLVLYSDGIQEYLELSPEMRTGSPKKLADDILETYSSGADDAVVLVYQRETAK